MSRRVTLELPDEVLDRAERLAVLAHRDVTEVLAEAVAAMLPPVEIVPQASQAVSELSDAEVLKLADLRLSPRQDRRLSELLDQQQAGAMTHSERAQLSALVQVYEANWLRQAEALAEAVRRGLRGPLAP
jgi:lactam utilization protein B